VVYALHCHTTAVSRKNAINRRTKVQSISVKKIFIKLHNKSLKRTRQTRSDSTEPFICRIYDLGSNPKYIKEEEEEKGEKIPSMNK